MHDTIHLEGFGIPAVPIATDEFRNAARAQAAALGRPDFEAVYVPHPIQDQTRAEVEARADDVADEIVARLTDVPAASAAAFVLQHKSRG